MSFGVESNLKVFDLICPIDVKKKILIGWGNSAVDFPTFGKQFDGIFRNVYVDPAFFQTGF